MHGSIRRPLFPRRRVVAPAVLAIALASGLLAVAPLPTARAAVVLPPSGDEPFSIGNRVFLDDGADGAGGFNTAQRDNGIQDSHESGVDGVRVELYFDVDGNGVAGAAELARFDVTAGGGYYLFDDLPQGTYFVIIPASEFGVGKALGGHHSSRFNGAETSGAPGATGDPATDTDDNGREPANRRPDLSGVGSDPITFVDGQAVVTGETDLSGEADPGAPANEVDSNSPTGWDGPGSIGRRTTGSQRDDASNVAVDFGFTPPMSIGNRIWLDDSSDPAQWGSGGSRNNAQVDTTDDGNLVTAGLQNPGISSVDVQLYADENNSGILDAGDTLVATTTSGTNGYYLFDGLAAGNYLVRVPSSEWGAGQPLNGLLSAFDALAPASPTNQTDSDDNGVSNATPTVTGITTRQIQLIPRSEATGETDPSPQSQSARGRFGETDTDSDLTIDFGFTRPPMGVGSQVWHDEHAITQAQRNNGVRDVGETTIAGVDVALYRDLNANGVVDAGEDTGLRDTTDASGTYTFDNLPPGNYVVAVTAANFSGGGPLENLISSRSVAPNPLASDNQVDDNDNGIDTFVAGVGVISSRINLTYGDEPTTETGSLGAGTHGERNQDSDFSVDFGFYVPMSLGNRVWIDDSALPSATGTTRDNGELDPTADDLDNPNIAGIQPLGVAGVTLRLYRDPNANGVVDAGEDTGRTVTTNATGYYLFDGLAAGRYLVGVEAGNFATGRSLQGFLSSTDAAAPTDDDLDSTDKGVGMVARPKRPDATYGVLSPTITLGHTSTTVGSEPTGEPDPTPQTQGNRGTNGERDDFSNLTADFGFVYGAPRAGTDSYSTPFGSQLTVPSPGVLADDSDPDDGDLTAVLAAEPAHGDLDLEDDGSFVYTPDAGYAGPDSFTYRARNMLSMSSGLATVSLTVDPNQAPTADDDSYTTPFETTRTVVAPGVLEGDEDPEGKPLTASLVSDPTKGELILNSDGSFTFIPDTDATGSDTFTYRVSDGHAFSDPATVTITIGADPNHPPVASDDSYTTPFQTPKTVTAPGVLTNDTDADDDLLTAVLVDDPEHGTVELDADGSFTYTPDAGYDGPDSFTYRAKDARRTSDLATVELTVEADTTPPEAELDAPAGPVNGPFDVEVEFSEPVTGLSEDDFEAGNGTVSDFTGSGTSYELTLTPTASGPVTLDLPEDSAVDAAGNGNLAATLSRVADIDAPTASLSTTAASPTNAASVTVHVGFSEPVTGFELDDLTVTGGTLSALTGGGASYDVRLTFDPAGTGATVGLPGGAATDAGGHPTAAASALSIAYDGTAPSLTIERGPGQPGPVRDGRVVFVVTADEPVSDLAATSLLLGGAARPDAVTVERTGATTFHVLATGMSARGDVELSAAAGAVRDPAGNRSAAVGPVGIAWSTTMAPSVELLPESRCLPGGSAGALVLRLKPDAPTTLEITSTDPDIVPPSRFVVTGRGDGGARALVTVRPPAGVSGRAVVTVTATSVAGTDRLMLGVVVGTNGSDRLVGTSRPDLAFARGGADVVRGGAGSDIVCGGAGDDRLHGGADRDALYGNAGDDRLVGPGPADVLVGGTGNDTIVEARRRIG